MLDLLIVILIFALGSSFKNFFRDSLTKKDLKVLDQLFVYHMLFGVIFWFYITFISYGDARMYYVTSTSMSFSDALDFFNQRGPGTGGTVLLTYFPSTFLTFFGTSLVFAFLGYIGMVYFYVLTVKNIKYNSRILKYNLIPLLFFLPNFHFWTAGVGKDTISFLCIGMFIYGMQHPSKHVIKIFLSLCLSYLIRPHITIFLIASFGIAYTLDGKLKMYQKIFFAGVFLIAFGLLFNKFMIFVKLESFDAESIQTFSNKKSQLLNRDSSSGVDISSYPYPLKILTFLYRPFFFDINGALAIVASLENLILLLLSIKFLKCNPLKMWRRSNYLFKGMFVFFSIGTLSFSLILGNLGIMLRQKNMFMPALFFICLWAFSYQQEMRLSSQKNQLE